MERRKLGNSELEVAPLAFGGNVFGWTADERTSFSLLDAFVDAGFNLIDTADVYSKWVPGNKGGESEAIIGKWLKAKGGRDKVVVATKVGGDQDPGKGLRKSYILQSVEGSLRRLNTDYIDLYQSHYDDPHTPIQETLEAYDQLIREGKVRAIGASNMSAERLLESLRISEERNLPRYESLQPQYNLYDREQFEKEYEQLVLQNGLGVISYYSLASGFLTGKYRSEVDLQKSPRGRGVKKYLDKKGLAILNALDEIAGRHQCSPATIALAWLISRPAITAPIASATSLEQARQIFQVAEIDLDADAIQLLDKAGEAEQAG